MRVGSAARRASPPAARVRLSPAIRRSGCELGVRLGVVGSDRLVLDAGERKRIAATSLCGLAAKQWTGQASASAIALKMLQGLAGTVEHQPIAIGIVVAALRAGTVASSTSAR